MSERPTRSQLEEELVRARDELAAAQRDGGTENRDSISARTAIAVAIITGIFAFGPPLIDQEEPAVNNCISQRSEAIELVAKSGTWTELPQDSTSQEECAINEYVVEWQKNDESARPDSGTAR